MKTRSQDNRTNNKGKMSSKDKKDDTSNSNSKKDVIIIDEEVKPEELDERGNIKDLIDYTDEADYEEYEKAMTMREKIINEHYDSIKNEDIEEINDDEQQIKNNKIPLILPGQIILLALGNQDDEEECEDDEDDEDDDDDEEDGEEEEPKKIYNTRNSNKRRNEDEHEDDRDKKRSRRDNDTNRHGIGYKPPSSKNEQPELKSPGDFLNMLLGGGNKKEALKQRVIKSKIPDEYKPMVLSRIEHMDSDKAKEMQWVDNILKIPFGEYAKVPVSLKSKKEQIETFFKDAAETLDSAVYGLEPVKEEIMNYLAQFISTNNESMPRILALHGSPGIGKTAVVRNGIAKVLDRPMKCINIGGLRDSSHFLGFDYTYSGSRYGIIASSIIESGIMNPIIFMDELDKISLSNDGIEIQNLLIHLTDPVQNHAFHDKYFAGIDLDMSKAIFVFSFNEINLVHPVLKDRLHIIKVPDPSVEDKVVIGKRYLLPEMCKNVGVKLEDIIINDDIIRSLINSYCKEEKGVRDLKRCLETILLRLNLARYIGKCKYSKIDKISFPYNVDIKTVETLLKKKNSQEDWPEHVKNMYM
jgi:hypothetical protein